jgi:hypothetical protein
MVTFEIRQPCGVSERRQGRLEKIPSAGPVQLHLIKMLNSMDSTSHIVLAVNSRCAWEPPNSGANSNKAFDRPEICRKGLQLKGNGFTAVDRHWFSESDFWQAG